jgi:hypothetical protein
MNQLLSPVLHGLEVACLPLDPRFADSNPAEDDGILRAIKLRRTNSFGRDASRQFHAVDLRHVKEPYKYESETS